VQTGFTGSTRREIGRKEEKNVGETLVKKNFDFRGSGRFSQMRSGKIGLAQEKPSKEKK